MLGEVSNFTRSRVQLNEGTYLKDSRFTEEVGSKKILPNDVMFSSPRERPNRALARLGWSERAGETSERSERRVKRKTD